MSSVLTTDSVPDQEKSAFWEDAVSGALGPVAVTPRPGRPVEGTIATDRLGYLLISRIEAGAHRITHTPDPAERSPAHLVGVALQLAGTAVCFQDGRRADLGQGDLVLYDASRPYSFSYPERFAAHTFRFPRHVLGVPDGDLRLVSGAAIGTGRGFGAVLLPFLAELAASAPAYPPAVGHRLAGHVVDLFAALITDRVQLAATDQDAGRDHLVRSVRAHIDRHLGDPSLSPETIARALRISVRYLHRLFEGEGITVSRLVQRRRLEECARELARRERVMPTVSAVARRWGFVNAAHFSRAFRAVYGLSPREWRDLRTAQSAGGTAAGVPRPADSFTGPRP